MSTQVPKVSETSAPKTIAGVVLTLNEEDHLPACLQSLYWVDELVVIDSGSHDRTVEIAKSFDARCVEHPFENYSRQRNFALSQTETEWVLFVDADEVVSSALADEIRKTVRNPSRQESDAGGQTDNPGEESLPNEQIAGYWIPRRNFFWGRPIQGGGWWPDHQLRLLRAAHARYDASRAVHEVAELDGQSASLKEILLHDNYASFAEFKQKQHDYLAHDTPTSIRAGGACKAPQSGLAADSRILATVHDLEGPSRWRTWPQACAIYGVDRSFELLFEFALTNNKFPASFDELGQSIGRRSVGRDRPTDGVA